MKQNDSSITYSTTDLLLTRLFFVDAVPQCGVSLGTDRQVIMNQLSDMGTTCQDFSDEEIAEFQRKTSDVYLVTALLK